jgi:hypothetical protein
MLSLLRPFDGRMMLCSGIPEVATALPSTNIEYFSAFHYLERIQPDACALHP